MRVIITIDDDKDFDTVVGALEKAGMTVDEPLRTIRIVTGFAKSLEQLENVDGVYQIGESKEYQLADPTDEIQ